ncbi:MAG: glycosyltransferase family protein [Leptolyngbyaceae cyanobacterium]
MNQTSNIPTVLMYCQHVSGIGHYIRSSAIAAALQQSMRVVMILGGALPEMVTLPEGIELIYLPPIGIDDQQETLVSLDDRYTLVEAVTLRTKLLIKALAEWKPAALLIEHFPAVGRLLFIPELLPFLEAAQAQPSPPVIVSSLREILEPQRERRVVTETISYVLLNTYFDAVLVHGDADFTSIEAMFKSVIRRKIPVHYTGFVVPEPQSLPESSQWTPPTSPYLMVSAGGGRLGGNLLRTVIETYQQMGWGDRFQLVALAGVFLDSTEWQDIQTMAQAIPGVQLYRWLPNLREVLRGAQASISLCGYNTALDLLQANIPALVVPSDEDMQGEQFERATRLADLGLVQMLSAQQLDHSTLSEAIAQILTFQPQPCTFDFQGAANTAQILQQLLKPNPES